MVGGPGPPMGPGEGELVIERVFDAPRELVFQAFTQPEHLMRWWGPHDWTLSYCALDLRPGGVWHYCMAGPEGEQSWRRAVFREIVPPERLVYTDTFSDADGNVVPPTRYGLSPDWPAETLATITFVERDGRTTVTLRSTGIAAAPPKEREVARQGWSESFDKLAAVLAGRTAA
jgi:uncharacterized protein YndB with AHSA1/START domain